MKTKIAIILLFFALFLGACGSGYDTDDARMVATNAALGTPPPPQYQTAAAIYLNLTLTPTPGESNTVDLAATMLYDQLAANATEQAIKQEQLQREAAMSATAISIQTTATYRAEMDAKATQGAREMATASAAAQFATATQQAYIIEATASKDAWNAQATATERSWSATATTDAQMHALEVEAMITQQAADTIRLEGESAQIALAVERQRIKNKADAILPWSLVIVAIIIAGAWMYSASKFKEASRNPDGTFNLPLLRSKIGWTILRPELLPVGAASINDADGVIHYQAYDDPEQQAETTRRAQAVDALRALPPGREKQAMQITAGAFGSQQMLTDPGIDILPPASNPQIGPVLDELEGQALDE